MGANGESFSKLYGRNIVMIGINIEEIYQSALKRKRTLASYTEWNDLYPVEQMILSKEISHADSIIEFGCGAGRIFNYLYYTLNCKDYVGLDISREMLKVAKKKYPIGNFKYADVASKELPIEKHFSKILFMHNGIDTIYPKERRVTVFRNARLFMANGGQLIYSTHILKESPESVICSGEHKYFEEDYHGAKIWIHRSTEFEAVEEAIANGFTIISKYVQDKGTDSWLYLVVMNDVSS